ncbi:hypothetical protein [Luteimonas panaciterrae]|uniref:hypothetical protein n=1 Tax=Luteimonas panaciterrae TaxID=363885 RepID=UPI001CFAE139|nr:hypothetical protein [Luteimonas panaciterrae]
MKSHISVVTLFVLSILPFSSAFAEETSCPEPQAGNTVSGIIERVERKHDSDHAYIYIQGYPENAMSLANGYGLIIGEGRAMYAIALTAYTNGSWVELTCENGNISIIKILRHSPALG